MLCIRGCSLYDRLHFRVQINGRLSSVSGRQRIKCSKDSSGGRWNQSIKCHAKCGIDYSSFGSGSATVGSMASERSASNHLHTDLGS